MSSGFENDPFLSGTGEGHASTYGLGGVGRSPPRTDTGGGLGAPRRGRPVTAPGGLLRMALLVLLPSFIFLLIQLLFLFLYRTSAFAVNAISAAIVLILCMALVSGFLGNAIVGGGKKVTYLQTLVAALGLLALGSSYWLGRTNYMQHVDVYWGYMENQEYHNVLPTQSAAQFSDAGKLFFTTFSQVVTDYSVGWLHGTMYCVAPIMDNTNTNRVEFWAVGEDCCEKDGAFTCDDASNGKARGGVVVPMRPMYREAVAKAEAENDLLAAAKPMLVRWVADPHAVIDAQYSSAVGFAVISSCVFLLIALACGFVFTLLLKGVQ